MISTLIDTSFFCLFLCLFVIPKVSHVCDLDDVNAFGPAGEKKTSKTPAKGGADAKSTKKRKQQKVVE